MIDNPNEHQQDDEGVHDPVDCEVCIEQEHACESQCRCGRCCESLIIETSLRDAIREPKIASCGSPIYDDMDGTKELIGYLLNGRHGPCVFLDAATKRCTIHETRPLVCRVFNCDESHPDLDP